MLRFLPVIKEQLLPCVNCSLGEDSDTVIPVHHHHLGVAVWVDRVVGKPNLVTFAGGVHDKVYRQANQHNDISYQNNAEMVQVQLFWTFKILRNTNNGTEATLNMCY